MPRRFLMIAATTALVAAPLGARAGRSQGPAGSLLLVEENHAVPLVHVVVAARTGSAADPRDKDGLANLAGELARRGAAKKSRAEIDTALDALGADLEVRTDPDSLRFEGQVLAKNLPAFLAILADIVQKPDFTADELARTKREILGQLDEHRNEDEIVCARFFMKRVYGEHPYGRPPDGTRAGLDKIKRDDVTAFWKSTFVGKNLVFAASGDITADELGKEVAKAFGKLKEGPSPKAAELPAVSKPTGWSIQLVDKPDRQQTQIMFGHPTVPASHADFVPLSVALTAFGGHGMTSTMMDELRTKRGYAYGAYMNIVEHRGPSVVQGWVFSGADKTVNTLKLILKLYKDFGDKGVPDDKVKFFQKFLAGTYASAMDAPDHRLKARVDAEIGGLPADFVDTYADKVKAVTPAQVSEAIKKHLDPKNLAITMVATAETMKKLLATAIKNEKAIDVVSFDDPKF